MASASLIGATFARLSTSTKMLIILTLALLPLGMIATMASIETARANRANRELAAHLLAGDTADRAAAFLEQVVANLRDPRRIRGARDCAAVAADLGRGDKPSARVALFDRQGRLLCATSPGDTSPADAGLAVRPSSVAPVVTILPRRRAVRVVVQTDSGGWAAADLPDTLLIRVWHPKAVDGSYGLKLADGHGNAIVLAALRTVSFGRDIVTVLPVAGGQLRVAMTVKAAPLSANELLLMLLPILMWVAAAAIGWLVVDRLILRPLGELQAAVDQYRARGGRLVLPVMTTPAREIRVLGEALSAATATIVRHENDLEDGLARQTKLTREVHHRVKNNLQVVASLLNIHARGARAPEAAAAYGSIQRRVDALALVHRSHYAELEVNRGLALRPLIGELAANLRASVPAGMPNPRILLDVALSSATQDVAVPIAFLVTELIELAMLRVPGCLIEITLDAVGPKGRAKLTIRSTALRGEAAPVDETFERGARVVGGLARQLRSTLLVDDDTGTFLLDIAVMPEAQAELDAGSDDLAIQQRNGALPPRHLTS